MQLKKVADPTADKHSVYRSVDFCNDWLWCHVTSRRSRLFTRRSRCLPIGCMFMHDYEYPWAYVCPQRVTTTLFQDHTKGCLRASNSGNCVQKISLPNYKTGQQNVLWTSYILQQITHIIGFYSRLRNVFCVRKHPRTFFLDVVDSVDDTLWFFPKEKKKMLFWLWSLYMTVTFAELHMSLPVLMTLTLLLLWPQRCWNVKLYQNCIFLVVIVYLLVEFRITQRLWQHHSHWKTTFMTLVSSRDDTNSKPRFPAFILQRGIRSGINAVEWVGGEFGAGARAKKKKHKLITLAACFIKGGIQNKK